MENARLIREGLQALGMTVYGGVNAPYIWLKTPHGLTSWEFFDELLHKANVVGTPGSGFGSSGEGYFRLSAFGFRENIVEAVERIKNVVSRLSLMRRKSSERSKGDHMQTLETIDGRSRGSTC